MSKHIGWALIGASNVARQWIIDAIQVQANSSILNVLSSSDERGAKFAAENGIPAHTTDINAILTDDRVNAVYISTANQFHCEQTLAAARAGKNVLCEKPVALTVADARRMIAACRDARVVLGVNHHLRCNAMHQKLRRILAEGTIGRLNAVRVFHANFLPQALHGWRVNDPDGGGLILDSTIHDIDTLRFLIGSNPTHVMAMTQSGRLAHDGVEDGIMVIMRFPGDMLVQIHGAYTVPFSEGGVEFYGSDGVLVGRDCMSQRAAGRLFMRNADGEKEIPVEHHNLYHYALAAFSNAVRGTGQPAATGEDGLAALAIALAIRESARTGRQIEVEIP
ncbi:1,5-anhydro-D-fructose reductase (plasmid) [Komagataeibacter saccharivorans]|uniref:1,5-anhydro-D-fructose reductase n=1 Tax=Komagataeibacter saccharivorans TaxID=265959 RepID=A0A347WHB2_9PROT|nr:Gfo/Idh/MocA family oxidoreductase [Komagataeibacter saccharivorans]AXY24255.1 1,5-anhydro-D-fructose reductase [Komagataeibacter saccharivorans]